MVHMHIRGLKLRAPGRKTAHYTHCSSIAVYLASPSVVIQYYMESNVYFDKRNISAAQVWGGVSCYYLLFNIKFKLLFIEEDAFLVSFL